MQHTDKYKLNIIETSDTFSPDALNQNAETLETELARVDAAIGTGGTTCRIETGTYKGTGKAGSSANATVIQFERLPELLFVHSDSCFALFLKNNTKGYVFGYDYSITYNPTVRWNENGTVSWHYSSGNETIQMNTLNRIYTYIALFA